MAARTQVSLETTMEPTPDEVRETLDRVLQSRYFVNAPKKQKFLRLVSDYYLRGRVKDLNEYLIGREVFDRDDSYNPSADPIVRVGAHEIRKKLELYYQQEGASDPIRLEIPTGSYEPVFARCAPCVEPEPETTEPAAAAAQGNGEAQIDEADAAAAPATPLAAPKGNRALKPALVAVVLVAAVMAGYIWQLRAELGSVHEARNAIGGPLWAPFFAGEDATLLVLSSPPVLRLSNAGDTDAILQHSFELTPDQARQLAETMQDNFVIRNLPPTPRLVFTPTNYTGLGEAIGAQRLTELFRGAGRTVQLKRSRTLSAEDLRKHHVILLGSVWANEWSGKMLVEEDFVYTGQATIENRRARPGEENEYRSRFDERTGALIEDYAIITVRPNLSTEHRAMILAGLRSAGTEAAAEFVTGKTSLQQIERRLAELGRPSFFQALLKVGVEDGIPTTITLVALHELN
ncbi:MAG: hypothetical protein KF868_04990 [Acidobacteria bacterium]|nr:hypothetical protein [Acidobacteriota bacterium]MCW5970361.1 hypothetical protein [Blastocatellales bacterium]